MTAYYNEIDPFAAAWLRELIKAGHIAPGDVDTRSIVDVRPDDLRKYTQCHFFAGIGVWSYSLRRAGWPDSRPIWTGSCPCPPFSSAGKGQTCPSCGSKRNLCHPVKTGHFICLDCGCDRFADARHLWPEFSRLIKICRPAVVLGEQVASEDGRRWLDTVSADLQLASYGFAGADLCAAGIGAPHIRQRLYWMADDKGLEGWFGAEERPVEFIVGSGSVVGELAHAHSDGREPWSEGQSPVGHRETAQPNGGSSRVGDTGGQSGERHARAISGPETSGRGSRHPNGHVDNGHSDASVFSGLADNLMQQRPIAASSSNEAGRRDEKSAAPSGLCGDSGPGPTNGLWRDADWLFCRDGKWRPVEPGTFPLAHGATARVGRLRGYGNAINAEQAQGFIEACIETLDGRFQLTDLSDFAADTNIQDVFA